MLTPVIAPYVDAFGSLERASILVFVSVFVGVLPFASFSRFWLGRVVAGGLGALVSIAATPLITHAYWQGEALAVWAAATLASLSFGWFLCVQLGSVLSGNMKVSTVSAMLLFLALAGSVAAVGLTSAFRWGFLGAVVAAAAFGLLLASSVFDGLDRVSYLSYVLAPAVLAVLSGSWLLPLLSLVPILLFARLGRTRGEAVSVFLILCIAGLSSVYLLGGLSVSPFFS